MKRLAVTFFVLVALLCLAGILMLVSWLLPDDSESQASAPSAAPAAQSASASSEPSSGSSNAAPERSENVRSSSGQTQESASSTAATAQKRLVVEHIPQYEELPSGCEIVSLCAALRALGYDASLRDIVDNHLEMGQDYATQYVGLPDTDGGGLPPCIVKAANSWLEQHGATVRAYDLSGAPFEDLLIKASQGCPVLVWTTEGLTEPTFVDVPGQPGLWYVSEHCVVLYGEESGQVLVMDPLDVNSRYDRAQFQHIYEACGSRALVIVP